MHLEVAKISVGTGGHTDYCAFVRKIGLFRRGWVDWVLVSHMQHPDEIGDLSARRRLKMHLLWQIRFPLDQLLVKGWALRIV